MFVLYLFSEVKIGLTGLDLIRDMFMVVFEVTKLVDHSVEVIEEKHVLYSLLG